MNKSMPMHEAADRRPIVPGISNPFLSDGGNGDKLSGYAKNWGGTAEPGIVVDDAGLSVTTAIVFWIANVYGFWIEKKADAVKTQGEPIRVWLLGFTS